MAVKKPNNKGIGIYIVMLVGLLLIATMMFSNQTQPTLINYSEIIAYFENDQVREFNLNLGTGDMELFVVEGGEEREIRYRVPYIVYFLDEISEHVERYNEANPTNKMVRNFERAAETPWFVQMIPTLLLIGAMGVFWYFMLRQSRGAGGGNVMGFGKAKARTPEDGRRVTFADVAGADEEKEELVEIVEFLKAPGKFNALGARIPKGVLLMGPPGTGKTLLARAVAGEAGVPFFSISGSDFVEMFVGVGASRVRDLFDQAKKNSPSIIFIDEIDAVGRHRGAGLGGGHDEREQTLNQLLVEMDGFGANTGVIVIAATNRKDILDPALLRPGRFDRQVMVEYPDIKGREEILKVHTKNKPLGPDVNLAVIAKATAGFTGADLENIINEAALSAAKKNKKSITMQEVEEATIKEIVGTEKKSKVVTPKARKLTAYHEAGHAICNYYCDAVDDVHEISIIPRTRGVGGYNLYLPEDDKSYMTKREMEQDIVVSMGGRIAEKLVLEDISTGASGDIASATKRARDMVTRYGFSDELGPVLYGSGSGEPFVGRDMSQSPGYSESMAAKIDAEISRIINGAYVKAEEILSAHLDELHKVSEYLLEHEKMDGQAFKDLMEGREIGTTEAKTLFGMSKKEVWGEMEAEKAFQEKLDRARKESEDEEEATEESKPEPKVEEPSTEDILYEDSVLWKTAPEEQQEPSPEGPKAGETEAGDATPQEPRFPWTEENKED